jgi:hypothetical protein
MGFIDRIKAAIWHGVEGAIAAPRGKRLRGALSGVAGALVPDADESDARGPVEVDDGATGGAWIPNEARDMLADREPWSPLSERENEVVLEGSLQDRFGVR